MRMISCTCPERVLVCLHGRSRYTGDGDPVLLFEKDLRTKEAANLVFKQAGLLGVRQVALFLTAAAN